MRIGTSQKIINKWSYGVEIGKRKIWRYGFCVFVKLWFIKIHTSLPEGEILTKNYFKGFIIYKELFPDVIMKQKNFVIYGHVFRIIYPIKIKFY